MIQNNKSRLLFLLTILAFGCKREVPVEAGISKTLALERKELITNLFYQLHFNIPDSIAKPIEATETVTFDLASAPDHLLLDFNVDPNHLQSITVNGKSFLIKHKNEHILIDDHLHTGNNKIDIRFQAGDMSLNRNNDFLYTLFVPDRASTCFPVFDQPDLKAKYQLTLDLPGNWHGLTNGSAVKIDTIGVRKRIVFSETQPISSYQFAFAAGAFKLASGKGMNMYYRETDEAKVKSNTDQILQLHEQAISWLENYTGIPYPFEKMDFALIPSFQYGGMEHPGSIFYRESSLMLDPSASVNMQLRRASLIAHETAHMWFGNLVTMKWFDDVWLKEVFANFMAAKIVNPAFPQINHDLRFMMAHYPGAYEIDRSGGSHPIQQDLHNLKNAGSLYGAIIYQKAPIMMRHLETLVGEQAFQMGLQEYLTTYSYSNASWDDLIAVVMKHTNQDLNQWNKAWIKTAGMPEIQVAATSTRLAVSITNDDQQVIWPQSFSYLLRDSASEQVTEIDWLDGHSVVVDVKEGNDRVIIPNHAGNGYGYFKTDLHSLQFMLRHASEFNDPVARTSIWLNLWEAFLHQELAPDELLSNLSLTLEKEKDPLLLEYLCNRLTTTYWQFLSPQGRATFSGPLENHLFDLIALDADPSRKRTLYQCYRSIVTTTEAIENLQKFWSKEMTLGLEFSERDYMTLAYEIALRAPAESSEILSKQLSRIDNPDRQQEFAFVSQALAHSDEDRSRFFESLKNPANREHEPWVLEALRWLHHPLHASRSIQYIRPSLEMIEEIQLTGDIFFPKGWLDATLGEHQSPQAAEAVKTFLADHPELPDYLRNKVLQSGDMLFRAAEVVEISPRLQ